MRIIILLSVLLCVACRESSWKRPACLNLSFSLSAETPPQGKIIVEEICFRPVGVSILATHSTGEEVSFLRPAAEDDFVILSGNQLAYALNFDVPQGEYTRFLVRLTIAPNEGLEAMELRGTYDFGNPHWEAAQVGIFVSEEQTIEFDLLDATTGRFEIKASDEAAVELRCNPIFWLRNINGQIMRQAARSFGGNNGNKPQVRIGREENANIYRLLLQDFGQANLVIQL